MLPPRVFPCLTAAPTALRAHCPNRSFPQHESSAFPSPPPARSILRLPESCPKDPLCNSALWPAMAGREVSCTCVGLPSFSRNHAAVPLSNHCRKSLISLLTHSFCPTAFCIPLSQAFFLFDFPSAFHLLPDISLRYVTLIGFTNPRKRNMRETEFPHKSITQYKWTV